MIEHWKLDLLVRDTKKNFDSVSEYQIAQVRDWEQHLRLRASGSFCLARQTGRPVVVDRWLSIEGTLTTILAMPSGRFERKNEPVHMDEWAGCVRML